MSIITFSVVATILMFTYIFQFLIIRAWIFDYEKENVNVIRGQIESFFDYDNLDYRRYLETFDLMDVDLVIYNSNKEILFLTDSVPKFILESNLPYETNIKLIKKDRKERVILSGPIYIQEQEYYIYLEKEIEIYRDFLEEMIPIMIVIVVAVVFISMIAGMFVSRKFIKKLKSLKFTMEKVKEKGISNRVKIVNKNDEFEKIGVVFNSMMDQVEESFNLQKQFVQDASHELRTPLTILKGHLQMLSRWGKNDKDTLDKSLKITLDEIERLIKLVNDLLILSKVENQLKLEEHSECINVNEVIEEVIYGFDVVKEDVEFVFNSTQVVNIRMLREHLKQLIIIFVDNAIKYCDKDKKIIEIKVYENNKGIFISVKDNGIGIREEEISKVTDKFYRVDKSRKYNNSFGIGLSIASQLVKLYGGKIKINSEFGISTEVIVFFEK